MHEMMNANQAKMLIGMKANWEKMMARLEAKIEANQAKANINLK
jgi:hypothetical protein